jgi:hypothetical protein
LQLKSYRTKNSYIYLAKFIDQFLIMKTNLLLILLSLAFCNSAYSQDQSKRKQYFPIWTYHQDSITINGISLGLSTYDYHKRNTKTNGIKLELIGTGWAVMFMNPPVTFSNYSSTPYGYSVGNFSERVNGFYISGTGHACDCLINGISLGAIGQRNSQINGISATALFNYSGTHNGIQLSGITNNTSVMRGVQISIVENNIDEGAGLQLALISNVSTDFIGVQIGIFNRSENLKGIQIGLWNVNQERRMPLINWNFKN